ncbi:BrnA antitoxin family protein [Palleronia caenipelagi]|uniref:BrnA antitoxin family protein n=1 Tax=Palleronia caenipelagi TaxID=2489174 RepID=A0A547PTC3_9RHOB|nr:BrnA antitoxin family protein [Palleronia caenipelagi]TRD17294.1 BrnA antitoxin family protein [Palleronia caenipelagi]
MPKYDRPLSPKELAALEDEDIDFSDQPELTEDFWSTAKVVMPVARNLTQVTAKFDSDVVEWFKQQGRGYQARMNAVLRSYYDAHRQ